MNVKLVSLLAVLLALPILLCEGAPVYYTSPSQSNRPIPASNVRSQAPAEDLQTSVRQLHNSISDLKHELHNHEMEIRTFEASLHNQETILDSLRQEMTQSMQEQASSHKAQSVHLESRIESTDNLIKGLMTDMRTMKGQANESVAVLGQYKQKLSELEKMIEAQNQHMQNLEVALSSIMEVLQAKEASDKAMTKTKDNLKTYKVQPGDTLEKIARSQKISVQALREYNGISHDRIIVGQILKIP